jgi:toxin-antitoxin system PIN domain toxin
VIAVDTNVLVYSHREEAAWHESARRALEDLDRKGQPWAIPWPCIFEFYNIVTHPRIFNKPTPPGVALKAIEAWQASDCLELISECRVSWSDFASRLQGLEIKGPKIHDARIALICKYHGVEVLWSVDRDFSRFDFVRTVNPLSPYASNHEA